MKQRELFVYAVSVFFVSLIAGMLWGCGPGKASKSAYVECLPCGVEVVMGFGEYAICKCDYGVFGVEYKRVELND